MPDTSNEFAERQTVLVTRNTIARVLTVSPRTVRAWTRRGLIPFYKLKNGRLVRYSVDEVLVALRRGMERKTGQGGNA